MTDARRAGIAALLVLLAGGAVLISLPHLGVVRVGGVGLRWWYAALLAPLLGTVAGVVVMLRARQAVPPIAAWLGPALVASLATQVLEGDAAAASLPLVACAAPLLALLAAPRGLSVPRDPLSRALTAVALVLVLRAHLLVVADATAVVGAARWHGLALGALLAVAPALLRLRRARAALLAAGIAAVALPVVAVAMAAGLPPWTAWQSLAGRPALVFDARSPWVTTGASLVAPTTLVFAEGHRITAVSAGVYRVVEREGEGVAVREWRLAGGESLELRAGDELSVGAGARLRFEAGKRVPGVAPSGVAWADPPDVRGAGALLGFLGALVTLGGGAVALLVAPPAEKGRAAGARAAAAALVAAVAAVCWGVYAAAAAPDLALGVPPVTALARLPALVVPAPWGAALAAAAAAGLLALLVATADALRVRIAALAGGGHRRGRLAWAVAVAAAAVTSAGAVDAWRALALGCGLAAAVTVAPALAAAAPLARAAGAAAGAMSFTALALPGAPVAAWIPALAASPALVAAPFAWGVARALDAVAPVLVAPRRRG